MRARSSVLTTVLGVVATVVAVRGTSEARHADPAPQRAPAAAAATPHHPATPRARTGSDLIAEYRDAGWPKKHDASTWTTRDSVADALVVVLPDPIDSHIDWAFDAEMESVSRAFVTAGYVLDRFWLPWKPAADDAHAAPPDSLRRQWPGVMLFRRTDTTGTRTTLAVAYLVGEVPTSGVQSIALAAALRDRAAVLGVQRARVEPVRVVGPTFSGSAPSLRNGLRAARAKRVAMSASVISGGATAPATARLLRDTPDHISFFATVTPLDVLQAFVQEALATKLGIPPREIAYLTESGTSYGASARPGVKSPGTNTRRTNAPAVCPAVPGPVQAVRADSELERPLQIQFPMNVSRLRREYARDVLPVDTIGRAQTSVTRIDWRDPASASETPASMSELSAPTIERTLADIEQTLTVHHVRAVGIVATDVRDRLFLATLVKDRLPDVQVVFFGSHSLYLRPELNAQLRGALVVSTYPLVLENQFWDLSHAPRDRLVFTSDAAEGTYNATLAQLGDDTLMTDYAPPLSRDGPFIARAWITAVGTRALLPVAQQLRSGRPDGATHRSVTDPAQYLHRRDSLGTREQAEAPDGQLEDLLLAVVLGAALALAFGWSALGFRAPERDARPDATTDGAWAHAARQLGWHRESWAAFRCAGVVCAGASLTLVLFRPQIHGGIASRVALLALVVGMAVAAVWLSVLYRRARRAAKPVVLGTAAAVASAELPAEASPNVGSAAWREGVRRAATARWHRDWAPHAAVHAAALAYLLATGLFVLGVATLEEPGASLFFARALALDSGVTPVVPLLLGSLLVVAWCTWHLRRVALLGGLPAFEAAARGGALGGACAVADGARDPGAEVASAVAAARRGLLQVDPDRWAFPLAVALALLGGWILTQWNGSMETIVFGTHVLAGTGWRVSVPSTFDLIFRCGVLAGVALSTWTLYRLLVVWRALRRCLRSVAAMPLGSAFGRLPESIAHVTRPTSLAAPPPDAVHVALDAAARGRGHALSAMPYPPYASGALWSRDPLTFASLRLRSRPGAFDDTTAAPLAALYQTLCAGARCGRVCLEADDPRPESERTAATRPPVWSDVAQELVALYVIDYLMWGARHVRQLASSLIATLAITTLLLASYPFEPQTLVNTVFFSLMTVAVAAGVSILFQVNRDATLSRIARTTPGEVDWDVHLVLNLAFVFAVPVFTVLGAHFPQVRDVLFSWVTPALRAAGKG